MQYSQAAWRYPKRSHDSTFPLVMGLSCRASCRRGLQRRRCTQELKTSPLKSEVARCTSSGFVRNNTPQSRIMTRGNNTPGSSLGDTGRRAMVSGLFEKATDDTAVYFMFYIGSLPPLEDLKS